MNKIVIATILSFIMLQATPLHVNSPLSDLDAYKFETPNGRVMKIPKKTQLIIVAFSKKTGALANDYLETKNKYFLQKNRAIYIADINKMPTIISKMFALPKLRKYKHLIYLNDNEKFETTVPNKRDNITLLHVANEKITNISFLSTKKELEAVIQNIN